MEIALSGSLTHVQVSIHINMTTEYSSHQHSTVKLELVTTSVHMVVLNAVKAVQWST